jgi:hypothetical protein
MIHEDAAFTQRAQARTRCLQMENTDSRWSGPEKFQLTPPVAGASPGVNQCVNTIG